MSPSDHRQSSPLNQKGSEQKDVSDPSFSAADFRVQLAGGSLRWLATILTLASMGLFGHLLSEGKDAEMDFPFHVKGRAAFAVVGTAFLIWSAIAVVNWAFWLRKKKRRGSNQS
jgi:hypothetical protein